MLRRPIPIEKMVQEFKKNHPNSHLLKIDKFSLLAKYGAAARVESSVFEICGRKWKINVEYDKDAEHVSIYLENQDPVNVKLKFQVYVVSQLKPEWYPKNNVIMEFDASPNPTLQGIKLMSLCGLKSKGFLIEDCCMFGATLPDQETERPGTAECYSLIEKPLNDKVTWMMTKFSSFDPEKAHLSNPFVVGNRKWRIEVHPRGYKRGKGESFSVYLVGEGFINNEPKAETFVKCKLRVLDQVNRNHVEKTASYWVDAEYDRDNGFDEFMPLSKLCEPYLVKDKLYVGVEFEVISVTKYV
ncbi:TRAF-like family protein [Raphanus sativus]|uniref:Uncharacterized protein LOC108827367 n=1 Tax=Raphanus sativus TaxID=3726 RepID=A0A6J0L9H0_RAPSA|nr:uncharacterized protein LOC108827367 [Raphanus sativus]KAJ4876715.1 TRAF-like family protein [Raphanus sativus]